MNEHKKKHNHIPEGWHWKTLGEIALVGPNNGIFKRRQDFGEGAPLLNVADLYKSLKVDTTTLERVKVTDAELKKHAVQPGDLFFCRSSLKRDGIGWCCYADEISEPTVFECHVMRIRPNPKLADSKYLAHYWQYPDVRNEIISKSKTATMTTMNQADLSEVIIPLPPLNEQKRIAAILDKAYALREKRRQAICKLNSLTQSAFIQVYGDPVTNPKKWKMGMLGDVIFAAKDGPHVSPSYTNSGIPFLSTRHIRPGQVVWEDLKYISKEDAKIYWKKCKPVRGDILYTKGGTTGIAKAIDFDNEIAVWVHVAVLKTNHEVVDPLWLEHMLNSSYCYTQSQRYTHGIANHDLGLTRMVKIQIYIPPLQNQKEFSRWIVKARTLLTKQSQSLSILNGLFHSLQQRAFSGKLFNNEIDEMKQLVEVGANG